MAASSLVPPGMTSFIDSLPIRPPSLPTTTTTSSAKVNACFVEGPLTSKSKRQDEPPSHNTRRGSKRLALSIAGNLELLEEAEAAYRRDWVSAGDTSGYYLITWMELHAAYGHTKMLDDWNLSPIEPDKIHAVGPLLKAGGYRSPKNYLQAAKNAHVERGYAWTEALELAGSRFVASVSRGIGPPRQSEPLDFLTAAGHDHGDEPVVKDGPLGTNSFITVATFFLLRELEASTARRHNVRLNTEELSVTIRLSASKTDPMALGVERTWGCVCVGGSDPKLCPYHMAARQHLLLQHHFGP